MLERDSPHRKGKGKGGVKSWCNLFRNQGKSARVSKALYMQVDIKGFPVEVSLGKKLNIKKLIDGRLSEPREILKRQEELLIFQHQPKAMRRDV